MGKRILITGVAGFIGSNLSAKLLDAGHEVIGIDNFDPFYDRSIKERNIKSHLQHPQFKFYECDIRDKQKLNEITGSVDVVIHLAAKAGVLPSVKNPGEYMDVNINGTHNILEWMNTRNVKKLLFASSSSVYGNNNNTPFKESDAVDNPISPYAYTKKACELMNYTYHHLYKIDIINMRFFTVYGPGQRPDLAIHKFVKLIEQGLPIEMYGEGDTARDYTYVDDIVGGIILSLQYVLNHAGVFEVINIGNKNPVSLKELIDVIYELMNAPRNVKQLPAQQGDVNITYADIAKAQSLLGYRPATTIKEGIKKFIDWHRANQH